MKYRIFFFSFFLALISACNTPATLLPKFEAGWQFSRWTEEMSVDGGLIYDMDSSNLGSMRFLEEGVLQWTDLDTVQRDFRWAFDKKADEVRVEDWIFEAPLSSGSVRQEGLAFKVLESKADAQLWRAESQRTVYNPFTQDSGLAIIVVQWKLTR